MSKAKDAVIRISAENHKRLKELMAAGDGKKSTLNELMEKLLDSMDTVQSGEMVYIVGASAFDDLAEARGEAIVQAVKMKDIPLFPKIAVILGEDSLA